MRAVLRMCLAVAQSLAVMIALYMWINESWSDIAVLLKKPRMRFTFAIASATTYCRYI